MEGILMTKDMTSGSPMKLILQFSIPLLFGNIFQQMYNLVDTIIVGRALGLNALSSVGSTASITFLIIGFCLGTCGGIVIPVAQQFGAKKYTQMRSFMMNAVYLAIFLAIVVTFLTVIFCGAILTAMHTLEDIYQGAYDYLIVIFYGIPFTFLYNVTSGVIRALGDSKTPFYFLVISTFINIGLDLIFILCFHMGVAGAAYATVVAQAVSGILCLCYMKKKFEILRCTNEERRLDINKILTLIKMGVPMGLQYSITAIGSIMMQSAVNSLGTIYVSACTAATKIKQFAMCPYDAFATASSTFCSQNLGAKKIDRINKGLGSSVFVSVCYSIAIGAVLIFFGSKIALIFVDASETQVLEYVQLFLTCSGFFYVFLALLNNIRMTIQGLGYSGLSMLAGVCELFSRGLMSLFVIPKLGYIAVCFTDQTAWISATICVLFLYRHVMKKIKKMMNCQS